MKHLAEFANAFQGWMAEYAQKQQVAGAKENSGADEKPEACSLALALAEHQKQMDKPLRVVDDMVAEEEVSDVRPELEVYRGRGGQE